MRSVLGGPLGTAVGLELTPELLQELGNALVKSLSKESKAYFSKRGWTGEDPMGGPPIWRSFKATVRGQRTLEITSTFYGMAELARGDIPERKMLWLTQEAKDQNPGNYPLTDSERELGMKRTGRVSKGERLPLIVPIETETGAVEFRRAPFKLGDAWIHPGIAKFVFFDVAVRKWRQECGPIMAKALVQSMAKRKGKR